ncbi:Na(+)/H(+) antiporter NhaA [compost metagenome]
MQSGCLVQGSRIASRLGFLWPQPIKQLRQAQRELLPPVKRVQRALHSWVAYLLMPLFALANARVSLYGVNLADEASLAVLSGVCLALVMGKPLGGYAAAGRSCAWVGAAGRRP